MSLPQQNLLVRDFQNCPRSSVASVKSSTRISTGQTAASNRHSHGVSLKRREEKVKEVRDIVTKTENRRGMLATPF